MYCSVCSFEPEIGTGETASRETIPEAENEFSSESLICRTMTRGPFPAEAATTENFTLEDSFHKTRNYRHNHIKVSSQSSHTSKMNRSILKTISLIKNRRFSDFLSSAPSVTRSSGSESCPHLSLSSSVSSSASSARPIKSHHQSHWSFGMILIAAIVLSTFSTSTVVTCVPLGHEVGGGGGDSIATRLMTSNSKLGEKVDVDDSVAKGQKFVPLSSSSSILTTPGGQSLERGRRAASSAAAEDNKSNRRLLTNYHLERFHHHQQQPEEINPFLRSAPIQKLLHQHKDFSSLTGDDEDDSEEAAADVGGGHGVRFGVEGKSKTAGADDETDNENDNSGQSEWETVIDPHLYVLTEWNSQPYQEQFPILQQQQRKRRNSGTGPSLSIVNPLDVLRQRLLLEIARRRMRQSHNQIIANEEILRKIGRRRR